jgi:HEAT repeat protein
VYKIDAQAHARWRRHVFDASGPERLKAIRMVRLLGRVGESVSELAALAKDEDRIVRSCAVAALGEIKDVSEQQVDACLLEGLGDRDYRVQANAIEALEHRHPEEAVEQITPFSQSPNNRVRANAIKAMLSWRIDSAQQAIRQMLRDGRVKHRISAQWVAKKTNVVFDTAAGREEIADAMAV